MWYDKKTGAWLDPLTGKRNADARQPGKAVVLVADWKKKSDITDSGFAEAAAESLFASIVALDHATGVSAGSGMGKILSTPLHLIGHGRGTAVNSEIIQRLGTTFPNTGNPSASDQIGRAHV